MTHTKGLFLFLLLLLLWLGPAFAQVTASISGQVEDASGAAIAGATVTVKTIETGAERTVTTDSAGAFRVLSLPLGAQEVAAEKMGFRLAVRTGIVLEVGQEAVVNLRLEIGAVAEAVTVREDAPVVNTTPSSVSGVVDEQMVKDLPLNGRSYDELITLNPGAVNYTSLKGVNTTTSEGNSFSVDGRRPQDNLFLINGIELTGSSQLADTPGSVSGYMLGIDAVREFNLLTDTYSAEYGKRAGGQVVVVTQSGSNALHGTVFEFIRNSALDAPGPAFLTAGITPPFRRNQFGAALGEPIKKNRFFLFGNYEGYRQSLAAASESVVPDLNARLGIIPNPPAGFKLNPAMLPYAAMWPVPNGQELGGGTATANYAPRNPVYEDFGTMRADYNIRDRDRLSASYTMDDGHSLIPLADQLFASALQLSTQVATVEEMHIISPNVLNTFRAGFSRAGFDFDAATYQAVPSSLSFVSGAPPGNITINGGITGAGDSSNAGAWNRRNLWTYEDSVQMVKGIHQFSAGVWFQWVQDNEDIVSKRLGGATFGTLATFLEGTLVNFQVTPDHNELGWRSVFGAWYVQDSMKIRRNLTFQAGLRYEFTTGWNEESGRAANYITDANGVLLTNPRIAGGLFTQNNAKHLLGPRTGLAWDPFGNGKTAVRAGFGLFYSLIDSPAFLINDLPPYNGTATFTGSLPSLLPITANVPVPPSCGPNVPSPCTIFAPFGLQPNGQTPAVAEWNFSIQQQITRNTAIRAAYVGSHGYHGLLNIDPNSVPLETCEASSGCLAGGINAARSTVPQGMQYIPVTSARPNPYLSAGFFWYTEGNSSYNALQFDLTHRLSHGLQFRAAYTWAKNLDMNSGLTGAQAENQSQMVMNRFDLSRDWGPSALDIASQASISAAYELPFAGSAHGVEGKLLRGWQVNTITTLQTGFPFTPVIGANISGDGNTRNPDRPSLNPNFTGHVIPGTQGEWFNPNAFVIPPAGTWGNLGRGVYRGPGLEEVDVSLFKNTALSERMNLQFRAEFFNVMNHVNLGTPNATAFSGTAVSPSAGLITALATTPRQIQFGLKLIF
ncbi:MAG TPA: carboxypeptidase regulatory-like domain-containing protein [Bryobacteraceae bacterium]